MCVCMHTYVTKGIDYTCVCVGTSMRVCVVCVLIRPLELRMTELPFYCFTTRGKENSES